MTLTATSEFTVFPEKWDQIGIDELKYAFEGFEEQFLENEENMTFSEVAAAQDLRKEWIEYLERRK